MPITDSTTIDRYYQALVEKDPSFLGTFIVGVKTTSIFCIPTCRARKPLKKNVTFYSTVKEAMDHGFRPCKVCHPTHLAQEAPQEVQQAIQMVKDLPKQKITDQNLREEQISPEALRRWFKKHYGMTIQAYQRMFRINQAYLEVTAGKGTLETAYDNGYDSLSGFGYTYKNLIGSSPKESKANSIILIDRFTTPLGPMFVCATEQGVCLLEFVDRKMLETEFQDLQKRLQARIIAGENDHIRQAKRELEEYFSGTRTEFTVRLHTPGTDFQNQVWKGLFSIPFGETASYSQQAERIGNPKAVRAVASANGANRIAIIIPCHRVIGSDGSLTGYGGGLPRKEWLLRHEGALKETGELKLF